MAAHDLLSLNNLVAGYGATEVLHGVSLRVAEGEAVALVGANGAGKTTTLRAIMGIVRAISGEIRLGARSLVGMSSASIARAGVAIVPEGREVFPNLTVEENLIVGAWSNRDSARATLFEEAYELFPRLRERRRQKAGTMSGGEQQMLAVARALVAHPKVLLIDEPSMGLAPIIVADVYRALRRINEAGTTLLLVEQNINLALELCERGYVMETGRIVLEGSSESLLEDRRVIEAYLGIPSEADSA